MNNNFIPQAVEIVKQAIDYDNLGEYEKALDLYRRALEYFMTGLKYEPNPASAKAITERMGGYMKRAEEIKVLLNDANNGKKSGGGGGAATISKSDAKDQDKDEEEKTKMRGNLSSSIVAEKPNIKWDDVAGLEGAKEALKEAVILPTRFPQVRLLVVLLAVEVAEPTAVVILETLPSRNSS